MAKAVDSYDYNDKLTFLAEWFDFEAANLKKFLLNYYPSDNTLELFDRDLNRMYLKRAKVGGTTIDDFFVGNTIRIYGRQVKITDYADCRTQNYIGKTKEHTFAIIKPSLFDKLGQVITDIQNRQFLISRLRMCNLTRKEALDFYESKKGESFLPFILEHMVSGPIVALELIGDDAIARWQTDMGPYDPLEARQTAPDSLRALYGMEKASNGFHGAETYEDAVKQACFFFPEGINRKPPESQLQLKNTTCCVIKPHAIQEKKLGYIISYIQEHHFKVNCMQMFYLSNANADEFLEVYKGVVSDYHALLSSFLDGPCVALEVAGQNDEMNVHEEFRKFAGPSDADIARQIRPDTIRAKFGCDKYKNAVHCTDLPEDTVLELEYLFKIVKQ